MMVVLDLPHLTQVYTRRSCALEHYGVLDLPRLTQVYTTMAETNAAQWFWTRLI